MSTADQPVFAAPPEVIGHRGLGKGVVDGLAENTIASINAAVAAGVDWVEIDATRTSDDQLVVHHNPATDAGAFLVEQLAGDLGTGDVPLLADALDAVPLGTGVSLDLKPVLEDALRTAEGSTAALLLPVLRREVERRRLLVTSFDAAALVWLGEQVPGLRLGLLTWLDFPLRIAVPMAARFGVSVVGLHYRSFAANHVEPGPVHRSAARNVEVAHEAGLEVLAWCPGEDEVTALVEAGVDAVSVNDVPRMLPVVRGLRDRQHPS